MSKPERVGARYLSINELVNWIYFLLMRGQIVGFRVTFLFSIIHFRS